MLNKVFLMGRLTRDPEQRMSQSGVSVVSFSLAVDRDFQRQGEEKQTDFINCVAFRNTADFIKRYFVKGQLVCVGGSIQTRTWTGQDGKKNYVTEVIVSEAHFTGDRRDGNGGGNSNPQYGNNSFGGAMSNFGGATSGNAGIFNPVDNGTGSDSEFISVDDDQLPF